MPGKLIRIFLVDGTSSGVRLAEIGLSTIKALVVPRASLSSVKDRDEVQKTGVYVLVGPDADKPGQNMIYIGETDTVFKRITDHDKDPEREFWEQAVIFVSADDNLTKAHVRYLEARLINLAIEAKRSTIANDTTPPEQGKLPEADRVVMEEFIVQARLLLGTLGHDVFEPATALPLAKINDSAEATAPPMFRYTGDNFDATCIVDLNAGQFIVQKGSKARKLSVQALAPTYKALRAQLVQSGVLVEAGDDSFEFSQDYAFAAATPAAQIVSGTTISGRLAWRAVTDNQTLADWQDSQIPQQAAN